ncbi:MAG: PilC/PilY family type IV pilus protein [Pseudomonadota bacterium]
MLHRRVSRFIGIGWLLLLVLVPGGWALAQPTATTSSLSAEGDEDFGTALDVFRLEDYFEESDPDHTITYSLDSTSGDSVATASVDPASGQVDLTSIDDANGTQTFHFVGTDEEGLSDTLDFTLTVNAVNDAPYVANAPSPVSVPEDTASETVDFSTVFDDVDLDIEGDTLTLSVASVADGGVIDTAALSGDSLEITFLEDQNGTGSVTVQATDAAGATADATVDVEVTSVNDAPTVVSGISDQTVDEDASDTSIDLEPVFDDVDIDTDGDSLSYSVSTDNADLFAATEIASSTLTLDYAADQNGTANVTVTAEDEAGASVDDTFEVTVNAVNDAPYVANAPSPVSVPEDTASETVDFSTVFDDVDLDIEGDTLTLSVASVADGGVIDTAALSGDSLEITFLEDQNGTGSVTVQATDAAGATADATVDVEVTSVNDAPTVVSGISDQTVDEDASDTSIDLEPVFDDVDIDTDGDSLSYSVSTDNADLFAATEIASSTLTLDYAADQNGTANVTVTAEDEAGASVDDTFEVTVNAVNDAPYVADPIADVSTLEDGPDITMDLSGVFDDVDIATNGDALSLAITGNSNPTLFDTVDLTGETLSLELAFDQNGASSIEITATDTAGASVSDTFTVDVAAVNDQPAASDDTASMDEDGGTITIPVMCNDYLAETPTSITTAGQDGFSESEPTTILNESGDPITEPNGAVTVVSDAVDCGDGELVDAVEYQPKDDFHGEDFFTYTITDRDGDTATGTVTISVASINDPPVGIQQKDYVMQENSTLTVEAGSGLLEGAYDVDGALIGDDGNPVGEPLTVVLVTGPGNDSILTLNADGSFELQPATDYTGTLNFEYQIDDGTDTSEDVYRVAITVLEAPDPPDPPPAGEVATPFNLANAPLEQSTSVPPNVLVVMDDSGSMDWNLVVAGEGQEGGFVLESPTGSSRWSWWGNSTEFTYLWDLRNNAYPPTRVNGRILPTDEALSAHWPDHEYGTWRARTSLHNHLYYNPAVQYEPWVGEDELNQAYTDAEPTSVRLNPRNPSTSSRDRIDITKTHSYTSTSVPEWDSSGTTRIDVDVYIPHYYRTTTAPPLPHDDPNREKVVIRKGKGPLAGAMFPGGPDRDDCAVDDGDPMDCTYEQEIQNFANYFQYYRSREYVTKGSIGRTIADLQDIRIGYETISATTSEEVRNMNALHTEGNKKALLDNIYEVDSYGGTPLRQALARAGKIFGCETGNYCPALPEPEGFCQQSFALLFSDGYWNGGTGVSDNSDGDADSAYDGGRYADDSSATLADVAMHYYETDLHTDLDDEVPVMRRDLDSVPEGTFSGDDPKMHQHMKTYAIAFGVTGTVDPADIPVDPSTPFDWPDPFEGNLQKIDDMQHAALNGRGRFLNAGTPKELQAAFESAFQEFTQAASSTSSAAFNSTSLQEGTLLYRGFYDLRNNTGKLTATKLDERGRQVEQIWDAAERLNAEHTNPDNRVIATYEPGVGGIPFRHDSLTPEQQTMLSPAQVDYLRGVRDEESPAGALRERPASNGLLGDIVNSSPVFVGTPRAINRDQRPYPTDDLYSEFVEERASRTPVVYVGANDGMLHGFNGLTGDEEFAYVPNKIIDASAGYRNPLDKFTEPFYQHRYFVDLSPRLNDVYMRPHRGATDKSWNTVLMGGLGAGGKGYFALNVSDPDSFSDAVTDDVVLWEFTDEDDTYPVDATGTPLGGEVGAITDPQGNPVKDLGYAVSPPVIAMSNIDDGSSEKEWVSVFGNGPNSTSGIAKLFVLFMDRGLDGWDEGDFVKLDTGFGVPTDGPLEGYPNALGKPAAVDTDLNGTVDRVYAGDRLGNLFRFDLCARDGDGNCSSDPADWTVTRIFTASYDDGTGETVQPILSEPLVIKHPTERGFLVVFGTGSYLTRDDADSEDIQSIYAIWDEGSSSPATALDGTRENRLVEQTITNVLDSSLDPPTVRRIVSKNPVSYEQESADTVGTYGWYADLDMVAAEGDDAGRAPPEPQFPGEKAIRRLLFRDGSIITTTVLPSLDEFSCFGTRPGSILVFDAATGGDADRPVIDFNTDGVIDDADLVEVDGEAFSGGILFNQEDLDGQLVDLSTLGGEGDSDFLFVSGGDETVPYGLDDTNDHRTGRLSWRELDIAN